MKRNQFKTTVYILGGILLLVVFAFFIFAQINGYSARYIISNLFPGTNENVYKIYEISDVEISKEASVVGCDSFIYVLDGNTFSIFNEKGKEKHSRILDIEDSVLTSSKKNVILYDRKIGKYFIFEKGKEKYSGETGNSILGVFLQDNGYIVMTLKGREGFLGSVIIINDENKQIAKYDYADRFPMSGIVLAENMRFIVSSINENGKGTCIDVYKEYSDVQVSGVKSEYIIPLLLPIEKNKFVAVGKDKLIMFNDKVEQLNEKSFSDIVDVRSNENGTWILDRKIGSDILYHTSKNGEKAWKYDTKMLTEGIVLGEKHIFCWAGLEQVCIDRVGKFVNSPNVYEPIISVCDIGKGKIAIITETKIVFLEYR